MKNLIRAVAGMLALTVAMEAGAQCTADLTGNGIVDGADLGTVLAYWGPRSQDPTSIASDLNGDGLIDGADLGNLLATGGRARARSRASRRTKAASLVVRRSPSREPT